MDRTCRPADNGCRRGFTLIEVLVD